MRSHLNQSIINQAPITLLSLDLNVKDPILGLNSFQLAARQGRLNTVLRLIARGEDVDSCSQELKEKNKQSEKTAFYLALEYGHFYLAEVLLALGANKDLAIQIAKSQGEINFVKKIEKIELQEVLVYALASWAIENKTNELKNEERNCLIRCLEPQLLSLDPDGIGRSGLIELALQQDNLALALILLKEDQPLRKDPEIRAAGYWAASSPLIIKKDLNGAILKTFNSTDEAFLLTLQQLKADRKLKALQRCLTLANDAVKEEFVKQPTLEAKSIGQNFSETQQYIYSEAVRRDSTAANLLQISIEENVGIIDYAFENRNFVALQTLQSIKNDIELLSTMLSQDKYNLVKMCFFNFNLTATLVIPGVVLGIENFPKLLNIFSSPLGYANQLISIGLERNSLPSKELIEMVKQLLPEQNVYVSTVIRCIRDRYQIQPLRIQITKGIQNINTVKNPLTIKSKTYQINTHTNLSPHDLSLITIMLARFNIVLNTSGQNLAEEKNLEVKQNSMAIFKNLPSDLWREILPYLRGKTLNSISLSSQEFYEQRLQAEDQNEFGSKWKASEKLSRDASEIEMLTSLISALSNLPLKSKFNYENFCKLIIPLCWIAILVTGIGISGYYRYVLNLAIASIQKELAETMTSLGKTCNEMDYDGANRNRNTCGATGPQDRTYPYEIHPVAGNVKFVNELQECSKLCNDLDHTNSDHTGPLAGIVLGSIMLAFTIVAMCFEYKCDKKIITHDFSNDTISSLPDDIQEKIAEIQQEHPRLLNRTHPNTFTRSLLNDARNNRAGLWKQNDLRELKQTNEDVAIRINTFSSHREEKIHNQISAHSNLLRVINTISPARVMGGLFNLFRRQPSIDFDDANVRLLCNEEKSDSDLGSDSDSEGTLELVSSPIQKLL